MGTAPTTARTERTSIHVVAYATDGRIRLKEIAGLPGEPLHRLTHALTTRLDGDGLLHVFGTGAIATVGDVPLERHREAIERALGVPLLDVSRDRLQIVADPSATAPTIEAGCVVVPRIDDATIDAAAFLLARSVALERYETRADAIVDDALALAMEFAARARPPGRHPGQVRRVARLAVERLELARWFFPLDRPDWTWDDPVTARLYDTLSDDLELEDRHAALLHKLSSVESTVRIVIDLWESRRNRVLEWAIVLLIVLEVLLALVRVH